MQKYLISLILLVAMGGLYWKLSALEKRVNLLLPPEENARFDSNTYFYVPRAMPWNDAKAYAEMLGGHLVTIQSEAENKFVWELCRKGGAHGTVWIGLSDAAREGNWVWVTGEPLAYTNWEHPPNGGRWQNYANLGFNGNYKWNDGENDGRHSFVVEFEKLTKDGRLPSPTASPKP